MRRRNLGLSPGRRKERIDERAVCNEGRTRGPARHEGRPAQLKFQDSRKSAPTRSRLIPDIARNARTRSSRGRAIKTDTAAAREPRRIGPARADEPRAASPDARPQIVRPPAATFARFALSKDAGGGGGAYVHGGRLIAAAAQRQSIIGGPRGRSV